MYQDGLHAASRNLTAYDWVLVMNDKMLDPVAHLPDTLALASASGAGLWATSSIPNCCIRGFAVGFSRTLTATLNWQDY